MTNCGQAIAEAADQKNFAWEYVVLDSDRLDAFCLPGGKIAVKSGLIQLMDNEAELAFIVAHEVAHALAEQRGEHQTGDRLKKAGGTIVNYATGKKVFELLFNATANAIGAQLPSTLRKKYEEDKAGLELMAKAGYNPQAAIDFLTRYSQESHWQLMNDWTRNNSCDEDRIKALTEALPHAQQVYAQARNKRGYGTKLEKTPTTTEANTTAGQTKTEKTEK